MVHVQKRPYELDRYISRQQQCAANANNADHRPTYQAEMDEIVKSCSALYERGLRFIETIPKEDLERCRKLFAHKAGREVFDYECNGLGEFRIDKQDLLIPRYVALIEEVRKLKDVLA